MLQLLLQMLLLLLLLVPVLVLTGRFSRGIANLLQKTAPESREGRVTQLE